MKPLESDWKIYNQLIPVVRDRYLLNTNRKLAALLTQESGTPTENFWHAKKKIDEHAKILDQCLGYHSRSKMWMSIALMRRYGLIEDKDMELFSESIQQSIANGVTAKF